MILSLYILTPILGALLVQYALSHQNIFKNLLIISGAFMLGTIAVHILPELYTSNTTELAIVGFLVLVGYIGQILLEGFSKGIEHGHIIHSNINPLKILIPLSLHSLMEAIPSAEQFHLAHAIILHKLPISIVLFAFLSELIEVPLKKWLCFFVFMISGVLGYWAGSFFNSEYTHYFLAFGVGLILHVAHSIIFEFNKSHNLNFQKIILIIIGFGLSILL